MLLTPSGMCGLTFQQQSMRIDRRVSPRMFAYPHYRCAFDLNRNQSLRNQRNRTVLEIIQ
jgi:hypothetical protein